MTQTGTAPRPQRSITWKVTPLIGDQACVKMLLGTEGLHLSLGDAAVDLDLVDRRHHRGAVEERREVLDHGVARGGKPCGGARAGLAPHLDRSCVRTTSAYAGLPTSRLEHRAMPLDRPISAVSVVPWVAVGHP